MKDFFKNIPANELSKFFAAYPLGTVMFPNGAFETQTPAYASTLNLTIDNPFTFVKVSVTGNMTVNLTEVITPPVGSLILIEVVSDSSARTITWGTGMVGPALVTVATKTHVIEFFFDGSNFVASGASAQIN